MADVLGREVPVVGGWCCGALPHDQAHSESFCVWGVGGDMPEPKK